MKGASGNPGGRKPGVPNKATADVKQLASVHGPAVIKELARLALHADSEAARVAAGRELLDRAYGKSPVKERPLTLELPSVKTAADVVTALGVVIAAVASGDLAPDEAGAVAALLETKRRAIETVEIEGRLAALEANRA